MNSVKKRHILIVVVTIFFCIGSASSSEIPDIEDLGIVIELDGQLFPISLVTTIQQVVAWIGNPDIVVEISDSTGSVKGISSIWKQHNLVLTTFTSDLDTIVQIYYSKPMGETSTGIVLKAMSATEISNKYAKQMLVGGTENIVELKSVVGVFYEKVIVWDAIDRAILPTINFRIDQNRNVQDFRVVRSFGEFGGWMIDDVLFN